MKIFQEILFFLLIQIIGWSGFFILRSYGINYIDNYIITILYFSLVCSLLIYLLKIEFKKYFFIPNKIQIFSLSVFFIVSSIIYYYFGNNPKLIPLNLIHPEVYLLTLDFKYFLTKSLEILFQQLTFLFVILLLFEKLKSIKVVTIILVILLQLTHLFNFIYMPFKFAMIFQIGALFGSLIFPYLILKNKDGFVYTYILHWGFYLLVDLVFIFYYLTL